MKTEIAELAWLAGFFDGEGCIAVCDSWRKCKDRKTDRYSTTILLTVRQCDPAPLNKIAEITEVGRVGDRKIKLKPNWRKQYQWQVGGNKQVRSILEAIRPYTVQKSQQIDIALELLSTFGTPGHTGKKMLSGDVIAIRQQLVKKIQNLKHYEVDASS